MDVLRSHPAEVYLPSFPRRQDEWFLGLSFDFRFISVPGLIRSMEMGHEIKHGKKKNCRCGYYSYGYDTDARGFLQSRAGRALSSIEWRQLCYTSASSREWLVSPAVFRDAILHVGLRHLLLNGSSGRWTRLSTVPTSVVETSDIRRSRKGHSQRVCPCSIVALVGLVSTVLSISSRYGRLRSNQARQRS
jgi:hypothetical protein